MAYGMTESIGITMLRGDEWLDHEGSVGRGFRGTEIRILDDDQGNVPVGETGEIYLRNPAYGGSEYLGEAPAMRGTDDGFFTVGDLGYVDADGYVYVVDRRVDVIITGGANVFPSEVEAALIDHPKIADVVVIGLPDPEWGRRVPRDRRACAPRRAADRRRSDRVREGPARGVQGAEERRVRRRNPAQCSNQGEPRCAHRGTGRLRVSGTQPTAVRADGCDPERARRGALARVAHGRARRRAFPASKSSPSLPGRS